MRPLDNALWQVLSLVSKRPGISAPEIYRESDWTREYMGPTAINARLSRLVNLGLVSRERLGKVVRYTVV